MLRRLFVGLCAVSLAACTHRVYSMEPDEATVEAIRTELDDVCDDDRCVLGRCWSEHEDLVVCRIDGSFLSAGRKRSVLRSLRSRLAERGIEAGFCAHDSAGTQLAGGLGCAVAVGVLSGAAGGNGAGAVMCGSDDVEELGPDEGMEEACASEPVVP